MSTKRERPNSFAGLLNLGKPSLAPTEAPTIDPERAVETAVPTAVLREVLSEGQSERVAPPDTASASAPSFSTEVSTEGNTPLLAPILQNRQKKERLLSWTVRLPESLKSRLERASKQYEIDMTAIVVAGTRDYLDRYFPDPKPE